MGGSGGGGSSTNTVQKADPWVGVQPGLRELYGAAGDWFAGQTPQFFPQSTVVGLAPETQAALGGTTARAISGSPLVDEAQAEAMRTLGGQYFGASPAFPYQAAAAGGGFLGSNPAMQTFGAAAGGQLAGLNPAQGFFQGQTAGQGLGANPALGAYGDVAGGQLAGLNPAYDYFGQAAGGGFVGQNPYLDAMFESASDPLVRQFQKATMPGIASMFSGAGRYGSEAMQEAISGQQDVLGRNLAGLSSNIYGNAYAQERGLQQQAAGQLGALGQQDIATIMQGISGMGGTAENALQRQQAAAGQLAGLGQFDINTLMQGASGLGGLYAGERGLQQQAADALSQDYARERTFQQQAMGQAPGLAGTDYADLQALLGVGGAREAQQGQILADQMARWDFGQNQELNKLLQYSQLLQGAGGYGTTSTTGSQDAARNPLGGALSGAMTGYGLGSALGGTGGMLAGTSYGSSLGPWGALAGAVLGGLFM